MTEPTGGVLLDPAPRCRSPSLPSRRNVAGTVQEVTVPQLTTEDGIMRMAVKQNGEYKDFAIVSYQGE